MLTRRDSLPYRPYLSRSGAGWDTRLARALPVLLIILVGVMPATWFLSGQPVSFFDEDLPLPPFYNLETYLSAWYRLSPPGVFLIRPLATLLYMSYFVLLTNLGVSLFISQALYLVGCTLLAGLSMYYLFLTLFRHHLSRMGALVAALLYMNNPILYHIMWRYMLITLYPVYALTPLLLILYTRAIRSHNIYRYAALSAVLLLFASPVGTSLAYATPIIVIVVGYMVFSVTSGTLPTGALSTTLKFLLVMGILGFLLQAWWMLPQAAFLDRILSISIGYRPATGMSNMDTLMLNSQTPSFVNLFQMQGHYASYVTDVGNQPWSSYDTKYFEPLFVALGFVAPILAVLGMLNRSGGTWLIYFGGLFVSALFLMKGAYPPLGQLYIWAFENIRFAAAYRSFYDKFGFLLPFACSALAGLGAMQVLDQLSKFLERRGRRQYAVCAVVLSELSLIVTLGLWTYPFWTGEVIPRPNAVRAGAHVRVPGYYSVANAWLQEQGQDFRIMTLPLSRLYYGAFTWDSGFWGTDPSAWLFSTPTIARVTTSTSYALPIWIAESINSGTPTNSACLLALLNVRYLMLHGDATWEYVQDYDDWFVTRPNGVSESRLKKSLSIQPGLRLVTSIGPLYFYENAHVLAHTYVTTRLASIEGGLDALVSHYTECEAQPAPAIVLSELDSAYGAQVHEAERRLAQEDVENLPSIRVIRVDPNHYDVHVENARAPYVLVFGESYDPLWSAKVGNREIASHWPVNGYANAWYVEELGSYDISIRFKPQQVVKLGLGLSGLGACLTLAALAWGSRARGAGRGLGK